MDDVTRFLMASGLKPVEKTFLGSDFLLGLQVTTPHYSLTYRQEKERLILCDFTATAADGQALLALMTLLRRVIKAVPTLRYVDAMVLPARDPEIDRARRRLSEVMLAEGAQPVRLDDELWLRYHC